MPWPSCRLSGSFARNKVRATASVSLEDGNVRRSGRGALNRSGVREPPQMAPRAGHGGPARSGERHLHGLERILEAVGLGLEDVGAAVDGLEEGEQIRLIDGREQILD